MLFDLAGDLNVCTITMNEVGSAAVSALALFLDQVCPSDKTFRSRCADVGHLADQCHCHVPHRLRHPVYPLRWGRIFRGGRDCLRILRQARQASHPPATPSSCPWNEGQGKEYLWVSFQFNIRITILYFVPLCSMPSTHSAVITHFAVYIPLACAFLPLHPSLPNSKWTRLLPSLVAVPWASAIVYSRMWLGHHTWPQCLAGCLYGTGFALIWFKLWTNGFNALGQSAEVAFHDALNR